MLLPFYFLVITAFKNTDEALSTPALAPPSKPDPDDFSASLATDRFGQPDQSARSTA